MMPRVANEGGGGMGLVGGRVRLLIFIGLTAFATAPAAAQAGDPDFLSVAAGYFDWADQDDTAAEFRMEYRSSEKFWIFKPLAGAMATTDGAWFLYAGFATDVYFGNRVVVTPSFAPGYYHHGSGLDLGYELEFRSQIEFAWRFDDRSRLGLALSHMSNASLGDTNAGAESAMIYYSMPIPVLFGP
jgi:hypothetical protein